MFGDFKNPATMEIIDPSDPTGTKKTRLVLNRETGQWQPALVDGRPATSGYATPIGPDGMSASQRGNLQLGGARLGETVRHDQATEALGSTNSQERVRHDQVTEGQGAERITQGAQRVAQGDRHLSQGDQRVAQGRAHDAGAAIARLNVLRRRADTGQTDEERKAYAAQAHR